MENIYSVEQIKGLNKFVTKTYLWMIYGLLMSCASAYILLSTPSLLYPILTNRLFYFGIIIAQLVLAVSLRIDSRKMENAMSYIVKFTLYTVLTGVTFSVIALVYARESIVGAFISTAGLFGFLCLYGFTTKRDLTKLGTILFPALIGIIAISFINLIFLHSSTTELFLAVATMIVFVGITAYDAQKMKAFYFYFESDQNKQTSLSIAFALTLYLDFINLFLSLLRIFGRGRD